MRCPVFLPMLVAVLLLGAMFNTQAAPDPTPAASPNPRAHPPTEAVKKELTTVIDDQLAAFRANDYAKAFTFASSGIQGMFAPEDFEKMVRTVYPVIANSVSNTYGVMFDAGEEAVVNVRVQNASKQSIEYQYLLKKEAGAWKINGVSEVKAEGLSV